MANLDNIFIRVRLASVDVEMRCKSCGNGVAGVYGEHPDNMMMKRHFFEEAASAHKTVCTGQDVPSFEFVVLNCRAHVK